MKGSSNNNESFKVRAFNPSEFSEELKRTGFDCGDTILNGFLQKQLKREFVRDNLNALLLIDDINIVGFVTAKPHFLVRDEVPSEMFPHSLAPTVPVVKIPMLAIDKKHQRQGWGIELMRAILDYSIESADQFKGIKGVYLDAAPNAVPFYESLDFQAISNVPDQNGTIPMLISMDTLRSASESWQDAG
ncbi:GNAT family N-acetyltransferase [Pectobacterium brasiliense]|uniref:GNAT family N-acetyltransferase n=1 Tax=Pectobacterium brasiliense TaxID=180957 RepID=UPI000B97A899|nr:GNAT family N-acetyltransferase [Pectobacterium carotovorum]OYN52670.1 hypothetical protein B7L51_03965 [Pectobacterium carotovorum]OYN52671.1 hypothetical protein B7L51_03970 [Pectobacterium carotovorum]